MSRRMEGGAAVPDKPRPPVLEFPPGAGFPVGLHRLLLSHRQSYLHQNPFFSFCVVNVTIPSHERNHQRGQAHNADL